MKIEQFFAAYQPEQFKSYLTYKKQQREAVGKSPVGIVASELISHGVSGLIEWEGTCETIGGSSVLTKTRTQEDSTESKDPNVLANYAAVVLGLSLRHIEIALTDKKFYPQEFFAEYNSVFANTMLPKMLTDVKEEVLSDRDWKKMIECANEDTTFSIFFEEGGFKHLPEFLRNFLIWDGLNNIPVIVLMHREILSGYKERVKAFFAPDPLNNLKTEEDFNVLFADIKNHFEHK